MKCEVCEVREADRAFSAETAGKRQPFLLRVCAFCAVGLAEPVGVDQVGVDVIRKASPYRT
jgi:protein-arginine kinase activator protein McsA